jgi:hypothetical protein
MAVPIFVCERCTDTTFEFDHLEPPRWRPNEASILNNISINIEDAFFWSKCLAKALAAHPSAPQLFVTLLNQASRHHDRSIWRLPSILASPPNSLTSIHNTDAKQLLVSRLYLLDPIIGSEWEPLVLNVNHTPPAISMACAHPKLDPWPLLRSREELLSHRKGSDHNLRFALLDFVKVFYVADVVREMGLSKSIDMMPIKSPGSNRLPQT